MKKMHRKEGGTTKGICLCHYPVEAVGCPSARKTPPCVSPYISATLYMTQFSKPSQAALASPVRRCKDKHPCFRLVLISLTFGGGYVG